MKKVGQGSPVLVNPFRCRMWSLHDRFESEIDEKTCRAEIESFSVHGQFVPVLGRSLRDDPTHDVELVYGARRLFVARHLNKSLAVEMRDMTDREAIVAMDIENRQRADISPYERGVSYARWLRTGLFSSQEELARALNVSSSQVSRLSKMARLPAVIVNAFASPVQICEGWALDLIEAYDDPERRQRMVNTARALGNVVPRPLAREVYRQLRSATALGRKLKPITHDEVVKDRMGVPLFRIRHQTNSIAVLLPIEKTSAQTLETVRSTLRGILQQATVQRSDFHPVTTCSSGETCSPIIAG